MDQSLVQFGSLCTALRNESPQHAQAFREDRHRDVLQKLTLQRAKGQPALQHTAEEALEWGRNHEWFRGKRPASIEASLDDFVEADTRLLFRLWIVGNKDGEKLDAFNNAVSEYFQKVSKLEWLYYEKTEDELLIEDDDDWIDDDWMMPDSGDDEDEDDDSELFRQKILMGYVKHKLIDQEDSGASLSVHGDNWMEQMMPSDLWRGQHAKFTTEMLSAGERRVLRNYKEHSFGIRWVMRTYPMMTQIDVAEEKLRGWVHTRRAWIDPSQEKYSEIWTSLYEILHEIKHGKWGGRSGNLLISKTQILRDFYLNAVPMALQALVAPLFRTEVQGSSEEQLVRFLVATARDLEILQGVLYSRDYVYDIILNDPERALFTKLFDVQVLPKGELVEAVKRRDVEYVHRARAMQEKFTNRISQILQDRQRDMHSTRVITEVLLHEFLPLSDRPLILYRLMKEDLSTDNGTWLWRILEELDSGRPTTHFDFGVQSTTLNPTRLIKHWFSQKWTVVFSILCPKSSRLYFLDYNRRSSEGEILLRPRSILDITSYSVVPNFLISTRVFDPTQAWLIVLYCTLRL